MRLRMKENLKRKESVDRLIKNKSTSFDKNNVNSNESQDNGIVEQKLDELNPYVSIIQECEPDKRTINSIDLTHRNSRIDVTRLSHNFRYNKGVLFKESLKLKDSCQIEQQKSIS